MKAYCLLTFLTLRSPFHFCVFSFSFVDDTKIHKFVYHVFLFCFAFMFVESVLSFIISLDK